MKRHIHIAMIVLGLGLGDVATTAAHEGHESKVMGTVTMAATDHLMLKDTANKDVTVKVTKDTQVKSKPPVKVQDIKAGTRVVVTTIEEKDASLRATVIEVGSSPSK